MDVSWPGPRLSPKWERRIPGECSPKARWRRGLAPASDTASAHKRVKVRKRPGLTLPDTLWKLIDVLRHPVGNTVCSNEESAPSPMMMAMTKESPRISSPCQLTNLSGEECHPYDWRHAQFNGDCSGFVGKGCGRRHWIATWKAVTLQPHTMRVGLGSLWGTRTADRRKRRISTPHHPDQTDSPTASDLLCMPIGSGISQG